MIDLGQAERSTPRSVVPFPTQEERQLRNRAIETDNVDDWEAYRAVRDARVKKV